MCSVELDFDISTVNVSICGDIPSSTLCNQRCTLQKGCCWVTLLMTALFKIECQVLPINLPEDLTNLVHDLNKLVLVSVCDNL